jgi:starch synthase
VRSTGGLADTVEAWNGAAGTGTGFVFEEFTSEALFQALTQALQTWQDPEAWGKLVQNGMAQDFSWEQQSAHYVTLYRRILQD